MLADLSVGPHERDQTDYSGKQVTQAMVPGRSQRDNELRKENKKIN